MMETEIYVIVCEKLFSAGEYGEKEIGCRRG